VPHAARVGIWNLKTGTLVARLREQAAGKIVNVGDKVVTRPETVAAQERQANSCALALAVKTELIAHTPPPKKDEDAGADAATTDDDAGAPSDLSAPAPDAGATPPAPTPPAPAPVDGG
jgi:hypothetical protein